MCCRDAVPYLLLAEWQQSPARSRIGTLGVLGLDIDIQHVLQVFEYMETDLEIVVKDKSVVLGPSDVKAYLQMLLKGLGFCHSRWVLHRDVKPNNFLIAASGELRRHARDLWRQYKRAAPRCEAQRLPQRGLR